MAWKKASTDMNPSWDKVKQKTIEGVIVDKKEHVGQFDSSIYTIEEKGVGKKSVWAKGLLDSQLKPLPIGTLVKITWTGLVKTKNGRNANAFDVEYDEDSLEAAKVFNS